VTLLTIAYAGSVKEKNVYYGENHYLAGQAITPGYDIFGYNYQAHMFNGSYFNVYSGGAGYPPYYGDDAGYLADNPEAANHWAWPYRKVDLVMKWNDAWISNQDQDDDGSLDRHYGFPTYIGSGAWETNHMSGSYEVDVNGKTKEARWNYFVKIVAVPADASKEDGVWFGADGVEIGPDIWGQFAIIQQVENDPYADIHGKQYGSPSAPGFGKYSAKAIEEMVASGLVDPENAADLIESNGAAE
jgi:hypothetical protein